MSKHWVTFLLKSSGCVAVHTVEEDMHEISGLIMAQNLQAPCLPYPSCIVFIVLVTWTTSGKVHCLA